MLQTLKVSQFIDRSFFFFLSTLTTVSQPYLLVGFCQLASRGNAVVRAPTKCASGWNPEHGVKYKLFDFAVSSRPSSGSKDEKRQQRSSEK